jgi:hypothetical protein
MVFCRLLPIRYPASFSPEHDERNGETDTFTSFLNAPTTAWARALTADFPAFPGAGARVSRGVPEKRHPRPNRAPA